MRLSLLTTLFAIGVAQSTWAAGLFGMIEIKANSIDSIPKWVDVLGRTNNEGLLAKCRSGACNGRHQDWYEMVEDLRGQSRFAQMVGVHRWLNRYKYITDDRLWGKSDYWETPGEFVTLSGDCEDYSIAKYYTLKALGWREEDLRLVVLQDTVRGIPHAVLAVNFEGENYILDNLATEPLQDKYLRQYTPYYAVNATSRWVFIKPME
jgi:predicted transglutaminase-like cysteine proteinase